jgi:hypothetical protein
LCLNKFNNNFFLKCHVKNAVTNVFKTNFFEFQITNEISSNYNAFSIVFFNTNEFQGDLITKYFNSKIISPPYKITTALSFLNMLSMSEFRVLKEFIQLLEWEMVGFKLI